MEFEWNQNQSERCFEERSFDLGSIDTDSVDTTTEERIARQKRKAIRRPYNKK